MLLAGNAVAVKVCFSAVRLALSRSGVAPEIVASTSVPSSTLRPSRPWPCEQSMPAEARCEHFLALGILLW